jgi:hypothetical protein
MSVSSESPGFRYSIAPAWFGPAMQQALKPIEDRLEAIENRLGRLETGMKQVKFYCHSIYGRSELLPP